MPRVRDILARPALYHWLRQVMTLGMPFDAWVRQYGLDNESQRVADVGCGPADILRYVGPGKRPGFYLGVDVSQRYLDAARARAAAAGVPAEFVAMDLHRLPQDAGVREQLRELLDGQRITTVLLLGVVHHIDDAAARTTFDLIASVPSVRRMITWDVVYIPGHRLNNYLCDKDRGTHVRTEPQYDALATASAWPRHEKFWSTPGLSLVKYLHYSFTK